MKRPYSKDLIALDRIGCIWGILEALLNLSVLAMFLAHSDGMALKTLTYIIGDFKGFFINVLILKMFSSVFLALGSILEVKILIMPWLTLNALGLNPLVPFAVVIMTVTGLLIPFN